MANFKLVNVSGGDLSYKSFRMRKDEGRDVDEVPALVTELNNLNPQKTYVSVIALTGAVETPVADDTAEREAAQAEADRIALEAANAEAAEAAARLAAEEDARMLRELEEQEAAAKAAAAQQEEAPKQEQPKQEPPKTDKRK